MQSPLRMYSGGGGGGDGVDEGGETCNASSSIDCRSPFPSPPSSPFTKTITAHWISITLGTLASTNVEQHCTCLFYIFLLGCYFVV